MAEPGGGRAAASASRGQSLGKLKCFLERHDDVRDQWDRPRGGRTHCGKRRDPDALMPGAPPGPRHSGVVSVSFMPG